MSQKSIVVIFLSDLDRAVELATILDDNGLRPMIPRSTDELCTLLNSESTDLLILENQLPGFLTGIEVLERLHKDLLYPTTVLVAAPNLVSPQRIKELQIAAVVRPSAAIEEIVHIARAAIRVGEVALIPIVREARRIVQAADVKPLPQIVLKYACELDNESHSTSDLARDIAVDPKLTSMLLRLTNSSALAVRQRITRVLDAVNLLGVRRTIAVILSESLLQSQTKMAKALPQPLRLWFHNRSILIASVAKAFARFRGDRSPDVAYILGLLQEIGIPIMAQAYGDSYVERVRRCREVAPLRLDFTEQQEFGMTHADVSAALLQKWNLPQKLIRLVINHHRPDAEIDLAVGERNSLQLMKIGEAFANLSDVKSPHRHNILTEMLSQYEQSSPEDWKACLAEAVVSALDSSKLLSIPVPDETELRRIAEQFSIECPYAERAPQNDAPVQSLPAVSVINEKLHKSDLPYILVIEDDLETTEFIKRILHLEGIAIRSCADPDQAADLSANAIAILCDVHLGKFLGTDIVRDLRRNGFSRPVIMMSGDRSRATVEKSIVTGINDYLLKPFDRKMLVNHIRKHVHAAHELHPATRFATSMASIGLPENAHV